MSRSQQRPGGNVVGLHQKARRERSGAGPSGGFAFTVAGGLRAPRDARAGLEQRAGEQLDRQLVETAQLLLSELVTNCVQHGGSTEDDLIEIVLSLPPGLVRVEVSSAGAAFDHLPYQPDLDEVRGRGLFLVDAIAERWGIGAGARTAVWFELATLGLRAASGPPP